ERLADAQAKVLFTADGLYRRGKVVPLKPTADEAAVRVPTLKHLIVLKRAGIDVPWNNARDHWWHEWMASHSAQIRFDGRTVEPRSVAVAFPRRRWWPAAHYQLFRRHRNFRWHP